MAGSDSDSSIIDLRMESDDPDFRLQKIDDTEVENLAHDIEGLVASSKDMVKVKFDKFVNLVAGHDFEELIEKYRGENVIMSTDLLTDLANVPAQDDERKIPFFFIVGLVIGIALTWILLK